MAGQNGMLEVVDLHAGYPRRKVIDGVTLPPLARGGVHALVGPNAAGKSTLMRALAGLQPASGSVRLDGEELLGLPLAAQAARVTYMPQTLPSGVGLNVLESVAGAVRASGTGQDPRTPEQRALAVLERAGILALALEGLDRLSGGQRQLVSLAQSLVREPRVLLLDEPISALDLQHQMRVMRLVRELARERGMIVLVVLHDLQIAARWADGIVMLSSGAVAATGTPAEAITPMTLARVYGVDARVERCSKGSLQIIVDDDLHTAVPRT